MRFVIRKLLRESVAWPQAHPRRGELASVNGERGIQPAAADPEGRRESGIRGKNGTVVVSHQLSMPARA
jgi:hypothetical protein